MPDRFFITGIGTGVGKTLAAAILTEALRADYWKPVQAGDLEQTDTHTVRSLISNPVSVFHPERYRLQIPASPHASARAERIEIRVNDFTLPQTDKTLVIEGAGGLLVPLNDDELVIDLIAHLDAPVVLVSRHYLGSINHTLLTAEVLRQRGLHVAGIIFNGEENKETESVILHQAKLKVLGRIAPMQQITKEEIRKQASQFKIALAQT